MTIELITCFYREDFLKPLFDQHYHWVDSKTVITTERVDGKFDDEDKMNWVNDAIGRSRADWVVLVDMDEFIYPLPWGCNPRIVLEQETGGIVYSHMSRVWRHRTDADIDLTKPPVPQRLHGQKDHVKPVCFRPTGGVKMGVGNHNITAPWHRFVGKSWAGAHWANADSCFWIERETVNRGPRLSERNRQRGFGTHTVRTKEQILAECESHLDDPVILKL